MNLTRALEILKMGISEGWLFSFLLLSFHCFFFIKNSWQRQGGKEELATLTLALIGFIRATSNNFDEKSISTEYSSMTKIFHRPYLRAMFSFICTSDGNDLQYQSVLVNSFVSLIRFDSIRFLSLKRTKIWIWMIKLHLLWDISMINVW